MKQHLEGEPGPEIIHHDPVAPCPHCGYAGAHPVATHYGSGHESRVACIGPDGHWDEGCGAAGPVCGSSTRDEAIRQAIAAWNRRTQDVAPLLSRITRLADETLDETEGFPMEVCAGEDAPCCHPALANCGCGAGCLSCRLAAILRLARGEDARPLTLTPDAEVPGRLAGLKGGRG